MAEETGCIDPMAMKQRLERVVLSLETIEAVLVLVGELLGRQAVSYDPEIALVLMRCASDPLHDELKELREVIGSIERPRLDHASDTDGP